MLARAREAKDKGRGEMDPIKTGDGVPFSKTYRPLVCSPFLFSLCVLSASGSGQVLSVLSVLSVLFVLFVLLVLCAVCFACFMCFECKLVLNRATPL